MIRMRINRRAVLGALASVPGLRLLFPTSSASAQSPSPARDVIRELGVRPCINAAGTYTALTGSLMPPEVMAGIQVASRQYVRLNELHDAVGKRIAELLKCPAAMVSAGCASALSLGTAACVAGDDQERIRRIPDTTGMKKRSPRPADAPRRLRSRDTQRGGAADRDRNTQRIGEQDQ